MLIYKHRKDNYSLIQIKCMELLSDYLEDIKNLFADIKDFNSFDLCKNHRKVNSEK